MIQQITNTIVNRLLSYFIKLLNYTLIFLAGAVFGDYYGIINFIKTVIA